MVRGINLTEGSNTEMDKNMVVSNGGQEILTFINDVFIYWLKSANALPGNPKISIN